MRMELAGGWHLVRVMIDDHAEWIICDPIGDCLGGTKKHLAEFDAAMMSAPNEITRLRGALQEIADNPCMDPDGNSQMARAALALNSDPK